MANFVFISPYDQYTLGVRYLSSVLKGAGHKTRMIILKDVHNNRNPENLKVDSGYMGHSAACSDHEYDLVRELIKEFNADYIGISLASQCYGLCVWLSEKLRCDFPNAKIIWGGIDPTLHPELGIPHCDFLVVGEGEDTLLELVESLVEGKDPYNIQGLWANKDGEIIRNPARPLIQDLDRLPFPDFDSKEKYLIQDNNVRPMEELHYIIITQRGCPYKCSYCANSTLPELYPKQKYNRRRSVKNVMDELHWIKNIYPDLSFIQFYDDIFTINKKWIREFAPRYRNEVRIPFWVYTYPGQCDEETAEMLRDMGAEYVQVGIQSGSERTLKEIYRRTDPVKVGVTARILNNVGLPVRYDLIAGNPLENDEDHLETLEVLLDLPHPFRINPTNPLCFFINSHITKMAKEKDIPLKEMEGVNGYLAAGETHYKFWRTIFDFTQYPILDDNFIRDLAQNDYLKEHCEILETFQDALTESYWPERWEHFSSKDIIKKLKEQIGSLKNENDYLISRISNIEKKPLYKLYKKIQSIFTTENTK